MNIHLLIQEAQWTDKQTQHGKNAEIQRQGKMLKEAREK